MYVKNNDYISKKFFYAYLKHINYGKQTRTKESYQSRMRRPGR